MADQAANQAAAQAAAVERARWLAELAFAIDRAQRLARTLAVTERDGAEAVDLSQRLEQLRLEVDELRRGRRLLLRREVDPRWMGLLPWNRRQPD